MIKLLITAFITSVFAQGISGDPLVLDVIKKQTQLCRNNNPRNCIKPIIGKASEIKAIEINILSAEQITITTYNKNGTATDLEKEYSFKITGDRINSLIDVDLEINTSIASGKFLENACSKNDKFACFYLGNELLNKGNEKKGFNLLQKTCESGLIEACQTLLNAPKFAKNEKSQEATLKQMCKLKSFESCNLLGISNITKGKGQDNIIDLVNQCKLGNSISCLLSGQIFIQENPKEALNMLRIGCQLQDGPDICYLLGLINNKINRPDEAKELFMDSCKRGFQPACSPEKL